MLVYARGLANGTLPDAFWTENAYGVRGGVEGAFMSTTADRSVAAGYALVVPVAAAPCLVLHVWQ